MNILCQLKVALALLLLPIFTTQAYILDIGDLSPEQYIDEIYLPALEAEPLAGNDIDCLSEIPTLPLTLTPTPSLHFSPELNRFNYVKTAWDSYYIKPKDLKSVCKSISEYDNHIFGSLNEFWPIADQFGVEVRIVKDSTQLNGAYIAKPILNKKIVPKFSLFHYEGMNYSINAPIWTHEYGHAVLGKILDESFSPTFRKSFIENIKYSSSAHEISKELENLSVLQDKLYDERDEIYHDLNLASQSENKDLHTILQSKYDDSLKRLAKVNINFSIKESQLNNLTKNIETYFHFFSAPYHEFFADVFAGLYYDNMNSVGDNFDHLDPNSIHKSDYRRFIPLKLFTKIDSWQNYQAHHFFTPTRHLMGTLDLSVINTEEKKKTFLKELAEYIVSDIRYLTDGASSQDFISYEALMTKVKLAQSSKLVSQIFNQLKEEGKIEADFDLGDITLYCDNQFLECKENILSELDLGIKGVFKLSPNISRSNLRLSEAIRDILERI